MGAESKFTIADYVVFSLSLVASGMVGFYYACTGGKQRTVTEFLYGNRQLKIFPVAMSLMATGTSALGLLGVTSETYLYGAQFSLETLSIFIVAPVTAYVFLPLYFKLQLTSTYEYLQLRFSRSVRRVGTFMYLFQTLGFISPCLYAPSSALSQVTGLSLWATMVGSEVVCILYTVIGGIKAVVLVDTIQQTLVFVGLFAVVIIGSVTAGGGSVIWESVEQGHRTNFVDFNPDPRYMYTIWALVIGGSFSWLPFYACDQSMVQRYLSVPSIKSAQIAILMTMFFYLIIKILYLLCGFILYHSFATCDPKLDNKITTYDQILPYYVVSHLSYIHGIGGLFVAAIYSSSLSAISSGLNGSATVILEDIIKPMAEHFWNMRVNETNGAVISKIIVLVIGFTSLGIAFIMPLLGRTLYQVMMSLYGIGSGPFLGIFMLGMFFRISNSEGVIIGAISGVILILWVVIGNYSTGSSIPPNLPLRINGCAAMNGSLHNITVSTLGPVSVDSVDQFHGLENLYRVSFMYYPLIGWLGTLIVGLLTSLIFEKINPRAASVDSKFMVSWNNILPERFFKPKASYTSINPKDVNNEGQEIERIPLKKIQIANGGNDEKPSLENESKDINEEGQEIENITLKKIQITNGGNDEKPSPGNETMLNHRLSKKESETLHR